MRYPALAAAVKDKAVNVFESEALADEWMSRSCVWLDGRKPVEMLDDPDDLETLLTYLIRVDYGVRC